MMEGKIYFIEID